MSHTMNTRAVASVLEAFAVGDAMGMPTEFMTRREIMEEFGDISSLIPAGRSAHHSDLPTGSVTDDTEQTLYLLRRYCQDGAVTVDGTMTALLAWIRETDAVAKRYIGPSSLKALQSIEAGAPVESAGTTGTTCGGIMRTLAPVLCCPAAWNAPSSSAVPDDSSVSACSPTAVAFAGSVSPTGSVVETVSGKPLDAAETELLRCIRDCLLPTHNTSLALEAAGAYGFAVAAALRGVPMDGILAAALRSAEASRTLAPYISCGASSASRIRFLASYVPTVASASDLLDFLFDVLGTGLESADVCSAVFGLFLYAKGDVWLAIRLASRIGGDTDTIAALVGALCAAYAGGHNIPAEIVDTVRTVNHLDVSAVATRIVEVFTGHEA